MQSPIAKHSLKIASHKTSVSLESEFWNGLKEIARAQQRTVSGLVSAIRTEHQQGNLSSAIRLFVLDYYRGHLAIGG